MILLPLYEELLNENLILKSTAVKPIVKAIKNRNPIDFVYRGPAKVVKPGKRYKVEVVALGLSKRGNLIIRGYVQPPSVSKKGFDKHGWRTFMVSRMYNIKIYNNETFDTTKPLYKTGDDKSMKVTYVTSDWNEKPILMTPKKPKKDTLLKRTKDVVRTPKVKKLKPDIKEPDNTQNDLPQIPQQGNDIQNLQEPNNDVNPNDNQDALPEIPNNAPDIEPIDGNEDEIDNELNEEINKIKRFIFHIF